MSNKLLDGLHKTPSDFIPEKSRFLLIDDGPIAKVFAKRFPTAKLFNPFEHSFNPVPMEHRDAKEFASIAFADAGPSTLRTRDGKRALTTYLKRATELEEIEVDKRSSDGEKEAAAAIAEIIESPVLKRVFRGTVNFSFKYQAIIAIIDRAKIADDEARLLAAVLVARFKAGQIIIPDFGFYARPIHATVIRQKRMTIGLNTLSELGAPGDRMRDLCMLMEKVPIGCIYDDAVEFAKYAGLHPDPTRKDNPYNEFIEDAMGLT